MSETAESRRIEFESHGRVPLNGRQHLALQCQLFVLAQRFLNAWRLNFVYILVDALDTAILGEQLYCRLPAHAWHAGDIVRLVPLQRLDFRHILRAKSLVAFLHPRYIVCARTLSAGVEQHSHGWRYKLQYVAVSGQYERIEMLRLRLCPQRSQYVVCLVARHLEDRHAECFHELFHAPELIAQFRRRRGALCLVLLERLMSECRRGHVECNNAVTWLPFLNSAQEHVEKAIHP